VSKSSHRWLQEHHRDLYVKQALQAGYRSRAVYKLAQLDIHDRLFHPGMTVVDLGAAPGGWSQWVLERLSGQVRIFALDLLEMSPLAGVTFIQGDFCELSVIAELRQRLGNDAVDLVMSDLSPNITGVKAIDQPRALSLAEHAIEFASTALKPGGHFLTKLFQGEGFDNYLKELRSHFKQVTIRKPAASRSRSAEVYLVAKYHIAKIS